MTRKEGYNDVSIAYALAAGMVILDDRDGEKYRRRQRYERKRAHHENGGRR